MTSKTCKSDERFLKALQSAFAYIHIKRDRRRDKGDFDKTWNTVSAIWECEWIVFWERGMRGCANMKGVGPLQLSARTPRHHKCTNVTNMQIYFRPNLPLSRARASTSQTAHAGQNFFLTRQQYFLIKFTILIFNTRLNRQKFLF